MKITILKAGNGIHDVYDVEVERFTSEDIPFIKKISDIIDAENKITVVNA